MSDDPFLACYDADMPGVVTATWSHQGQTHSARMHLFVATDLDGDAMRHGQQRYAAQAPLAWLTGCSQGTKLTIAGQSYTVTAKPSTDGHGHATLILERSRST